jgi:carboxymethylenebutenolidase
MTIRNLALAATMLLLAACAHQPVVQSSPLESTPRHDEWVTIDSNGRPLHAFVVYPQVSHKAGAVVVIHENRGLNDWARTVADQLASKGYIAIAPDLLSGAGPNGGRTSDFPSEDAAREAISKLDLEKVMTDLANAARYVRTLPSANGKLAVVGFCWGGGRAFQFAGRGDDIAASFVFYGTAPTSAEGVSGIDGPVYGFYGGEDERVNATIPATRELMQANGKTYDPVIYPGAGHAFMRLGEAADATEGNRNARNEAWVRLLQHLKAIE